MLAFVAANSVAIASILGVVVLRVLAFLETTWKESWGW